MNLNTKIIRYNIPHHYITKEHADYFNEIISGNFPIKAPETLLENRNLGIENFKPQEFSGFMSMSLLRDKFREYGLYVLMDNTWVSELANYLKNKQCLEVMSGGGFVSYGLRKLGIDCTATDIKRYKRTFDVKIISAIEAIELFPADVLIVSWPGLGDSYINKVMDKWGTEKEVVYIGEWGGCTANDEFHSRFIIDKTIRKDTWKYLRDRIYIGKWS